MNKKLDIDHNLLFNGPIRHQLKLSVIVPAKDESAFITETLDALRMQLDDLGLPVNPHEYEVLVLANNCSDNTYSICSEYQKKHQAFNLHVADIKLPQDAAHIGTVRRLLMDAAYHRLTQVVGARGIIVSTDADSQVAPDWIYHILKEISNGADVVGGRILPRDTPSISKRHHLRDVTYRFLKSRLESAIDPSIANPWPRHFQCYGPSLAVTCEMYEKAGRLPVIPFLEDEEFRKALNRVDAKIRHSPHVRIYTSARMDGRVKFGFSVQLKNWSEMSLRCEEEQVESIDTLLFKFELKNRLRQIWNAGLALSPAQSSFSELAKWAKLNHLSLMDIAYSSVYFETIWENVEELLHRKGRIVYQPIGSAITAMRMYFHQVNSCTLQHVSKTAMIQEVTIGS
ncbi:glycosyltransferase [Pedobacter sandarakinus]|uniref:glycosyltransferase n=1 Tax=Pedobacter sandarakinus TaxID=353156 RepID=UPI0022464617|nr:glycosyltransferase family 2 protein [Pedobacter sandarakinus]MCX2574142.1 glycosyltransferase family 2 protein [Pedobacter sandarakinus]